MTPDQPEDPHKTPENHPQNGGRYGRRAYDDANERKSGSAAPAEP